MPKKNSIFSVFFSHGKNVVRFYVLLILLLAFLFFTNDFGFVEAQKTAIVTAVGIDRQEDTFIVTSQIALPQGNSGGESNGANSPSSVQLTSRGKTVADAFDQINAKTGWYPKLVFCNLIVLGEKTLEKNIFDALDFFLRSEYALDGALVCTCSGEAKQLLDTPTSTDQSSGLAIEKVLSQHAEQVGTALPNSLREIANDHYSEAACSFLPIVNARPQQEQIGKENSKGGKNQESDSSQQSEKQEEKSSDGNQSEKNSAKSSRGAQSKQQDSMVFNGSKTALLRKGIKVGEFDENETFAFGLVKNKLRLASFTISNENESFTLDIKNNQPSVKFTARNEPKLDVSVTVRTGVSDFSISKGEDFVKDMGVLTKEKLKIAEEKTTNLITQIFEKCRALDCDLFELIDSLKKYENDRYDELKDNVIQTTKLSVKVEFKNVR